MGFCVQSLPLFANGAVKYIKVTNNGSTHFTTSGYAQSGTSSTIKLAASDSQPDDFYNGMRITVYTGTGYGNTGIIADYVASTKTASVQKENGTAGFDVFVNSGLSTQQVLIQLQDTKLNLELLLVVVVLQVETHSQEQL